MITPLVELKGITKYFSRVIANKDISLSISKGEVLALLGENGAGKSTIMKVLYGLYHAEEGNIFINGEKAVISSPKDAMKLGIGMIQQHFSLVPRHTVTENIILGNESGVLDYAVLSKRIKNLAQANGFEIDPDSYIMDLSVGLQQKAEILKALYHEAQLLIMDEPTAVLTPQEADNLMAFIRDFADRGNSVVFISHKMKEVMNVADRVIVMRNGKILGNLRKEETSEKELSALMMGKELPFLENKRRFDLETGFEIEALTVLGPQGNVALENVTFSIGKGEIFGIAGVSGNGQQELGDGLSGLLPIQSGDILLDGRSIKDLSVKERIDAGIGYVHADRLTAGLVLEMSLAENMFLKNSYDPAWAQHLFINRKKLNEYTDTAIENYSIKASGNDELVKGLSGGNQQKVVVAREVAIGRKAIIFDQPTRGLDLGAIDYVHKTILAERDKGKCLLLISTELSEIFALSDRIGVLYSGRLLRIIDRQDADIETIGMLMAGYEPREGDIRES
ncbi:ABC transporter, ATP-binding protein (cluster 11, riboflavin/purine nucleoside/unknown) / ABC transporter, ATP-binding protein (cluster 11, riboflavin/purine nucleoside/unknown) [Olavius algarvensis Delta 1 endosymbiont]|nr:ABC transporter, ATP-binding protein (cluster 11, riboflavin/purine nucleoside/unknown) / ABC transporter, ATP-binding protein (cluster 11, riboflavin/purine nucleoside/unknown) [Olavius algarvensis Delta 1 endosymbiont]